MGKETLECEPGNIEADVPCGTIFEVDEDEDGVEGCCCRFRGVPTSLDALPGGRHRYGDLLDKMFE